MSTTGMLATAPARRGKCMPQTAYRHFQDDISRARAIVLHAGSLSCATTAERMLRSDLLRSGWMFSVGALDAYFCDAYTDLVACTLTARNRNDSLMVPDFLDNVLVPATSVLSNDYVRENWLWRMAARRMMDDANVLSLDRVRKMFNHFLPDGNKLFHEVMDRWAARPTATRRVLGIARANYLALRDDDLQERRGRSVLALKGRFRVIVQRRHDCIHNCDRARVSPQRLDSAGTVMNVTRDIEFLAAAFDEHVNTEFRVFLAACGASPADIRSVGY